ncbi:MAG: MarR family transcriptional regulator [Phycisphaerae bacterium]|nr:MarR family transcriptional regulator [Phycisphaerae bacterium]
MASKETVQVETLDGLLKALLVLSRTVDHILETGAVKAAVKDPLSGSKVQILRLLGTQGSQTSSRVARFLGVSKPAVTQLIDSMVRRRLVVRRTSKRDRREVDLQLTEKGKTAFQAVRREQRHLLRSAVERTSGANAARWAKTLEKVANALVQADDTFGNFCLQCGAHTNDTCVLEGGKAVCPFLQDDKDAAPGEKKRATVSKSKAAPRPTSRKKTAPKKGRRR